MYTDKLFTGQRAMAGLGIYHYGTRFYSPYINRFLSADTVVPGYTNPQSLNRYSYGLNNPIRYNDPTGHAPAIVIPIVLVALDVALVAAAATLAYVMWNPDVHHAMTESITNAMDQIWQRRNSGQKNRDSIAASSGKIADNNLTPGYNPKPSKWTRCGLKCKLAILGGLGFIACVEIFQEQCVKAASNPNSSTTPTSTPTQTLTLTPINASTSTPSCPPLKQCPTQTSTSTPTLTLTPTLTSTSTHTPTPTSTPTPSYNSPYQNSPWYSHPGVDEE